MEAFGLDEKRARAFMVQVEAERRVNLGERCRQRASVRVLMIVQSKHAGTLVVWIALTPHDGNMILQDEMETGRGSEGGRQQKRSS